MFTITDHDGRVLAWTSAVSILVFALENTVRTLCPVRLMSYSFL